jgi:hypothetical protein
MTTRISYNERVEVFSVDGERLGTAQVIGNVRRTVVRGNEPEGWRFEAQLSEADFDRGLIGDAPVELRLGDGSVGFVTAMPTDRYAARTRTGWSVRVVGNRVPLEPDED